MKFRALFVFSLFLAFVILGSAEQCGRQNGGALCPNGLCCSEFGWCGTTEAYCGEGCQSQCDGGDSGEIIDDGSGIEPTGPIADLISKEMFEEMFKYKDDSRCHAVGFFTYNAFIAAANAFPEFGNVGDDETRLREIAAFLGQTSHETTGGGTGWDPPDGPFFWGYCFKQEQYPGSDYCDWTNVQYPCVAGQQYYGRGPIQLSWNYNYGQCGAAIGYDLLNKPNILVSNSTASFESAFWFWMTPQSPKPSCHDVMTGQWTPSDRDIAAGRLPGYGLTTNIINGGIECGKGVPNDYVEDRIGFYKRYCGMLGVGPGDNLDCYNQVPFNLGLSVAEM